MARACLDGGGTVPIHNPLAQSITQDPLRALEEKGLIAVFNNVAFLPRILPFLPSNQGSSPLEGGGCPAHPVGNSRSIGLSFASPVGRSNRGEVRGHGPDGGGRFSSIRRGVGREQGASLAGSLVDCGRRLLEKGRLPNPFLRHLSPHFALYPNSRPAKHSVAHLHLPCSYPFFSTPPS